MKEVSVCFGEAVMLVISFPAEQFLNRTSFILGLQPRDKAAMLVVNAIIFFSSVTCKWRLVLRGEKCFCSCSPVHQYGRHDFTCN